MKLLAILVVSAVALTARPTAEAERFFKLETQTAVPQVQLAEVPIKTETPVTQAPVAPQPQPPAPAKCTDKQWVRADNGQCIDKPTTPPVAEKRSSPAPVVSVKAGGSCASWMAQAGIPSTHATNKLILNESGCKWWARNPKSGACGIPQAYPCSKLPCPLTEAGAVCQLKWMDGYVKDRYGSWEGALSAWYSRCGSPQGCWY